LVKANAILLSLIRFFGYITRQIELTDLPFEMSSAMDDRNSHSVKLSLNSDFAQLPKTHLDYEAHELLAAANENIHLKADWMTPAEALQSILQIKKKLLCENAKDFVLFNSAKRRKTWDEVVACEECLRWTYFRN